MHHGIGLAFAVEGDGPEEEQLVDDEFQAVAAVLVQQLQVRAAEPVVGLEDMKRAQGLGELAGGGFQVSAEAEEAEAEMVGGERQRVHCVADALGSRGISVAESGGLAEDVEVV